MGKTRAEVSTTRTKMTVGPQFRDGRGEYFPRPQKAFDLKFVFKDFTSMGHLSMG